MITTEELSQKELDILQRLADGNNFLQVADSFKLRESSIKNYALDIRRKLDAANTANAIAIAIRRGLID